MPGGAAVTRAGDPGPHVGPPNTVCSYLATLRRTTPTRPGRAGNGAVAAGPAGESDLALSGPGSGFEAVGFEHRRVLRGRPRRGTQPAAGSGGGCCGTPTPCRGTAGGGPGTPG